jgi:hypothetical protein
LKTQQRPRAVFWLMCSLSEFMIDGALTDQATCPVIVLLTERQVLGGVLLAASILHTRSKKLRDTPSRPSRRVRTVRIRRVDLKLRPGT